MVKIMRVESGSRADRAGIRAGDNLISINGREIRDVLDYRFFLAEQSVTLKVSRESEEIEVTLVGLCTDICVVSNAMLIKAALPEINVKIVADACAGVSPESHAAALTTMKMCQIDII